MMIPRVIKKPQEYYYFVNLAFPNINPTSKTLKILENHN